MDLVIITALVVTTVLFVEMCFAGSQLTSSVSLGSAVLSEPCYYVYCTVYRIFFGSTVWSSCCYYSQTTLCVVLF